MTSVLDQVHSIATALADDPIQAAMARALLTGYDRRWREENRALELELVEETVVSPLTNPESGRHSRTYQVAGKLDKVARESHDRMVLFDHKTTSNSIVDPNSTYWRQLVVEGQATHYDLLCMANGLKIHRICWDVVRKPRLRPKRISKADQKLIQEEGTYFGVQVTPGLQETPPAEETAQLFEARLTKAIVSEPEEYFQRRNVPRTRDELLEYAEELWQIAYDIRQSRQHERHYRNSAACMMYGRPCQYLGLCSGHDYPESDRWTTAPVHVELEMELPENRDKFFDEMEIITNSRAKTYQTCRRKHHYRYEMALVKREEERKDALIFGTLWHHCMDAYWKATCKNGRDV